MMNARTLEDSRLVDEGCNSSVKCREILPPVVCPDATLHVDVSISVRSSQPAVFLDRRDLASLRRAIVGRGIDASALQDPKVSLYCRLNGNM